jgi:hypothetical protein
LKPAAGGGDGDGTEPMPGDPTVAAPPEERGFAAANRRVVDDWLNAIAAKRAPACSGVAGMKAVEMAHGIFAAGLIHERIKFPLANRRHPLG